MRKIFTLAFSLAVSFAVNAATIPVSSATTWTGAELGSVADNDEIIVTTGGVLTVNNPTAPNVSITIQAGGRCIIQDISTKTGENITVNFGGILDIDPQAGTDITIGQNVKVDGIDIPDAITDANLMVLLSLAGTKIATANILDNGTYPKITFAGDLTVEQGALFNINYPAIESRTQIEFTDLYVKAEAMPLEFVPLMKSLLSAEHLSYAQYLDSGLLPPGLLFLAESKFATITGDVHPTVKLREIALSISMPNRIALAGAIGISPASLPADGAYLNKTLDFGAYSIPVPSSVTKDIPFTLDIPTADTYTLIMPQAVSGDNAWFLVDSDVPATKIELADPLAANRTYSVALLAGATNRLSIVGEPITTSISNIDHADEIVSTRYYTLSGIEVSAPQRGINIVKNIYSSGKIETEKKMVR